MSDQWMGSIAAQDQYRPLGNDPWTNTMRGTLPAPGQGFEPVQQSPVLYNTKAGPITEADISSAIDVGMGVSGGGLSVKDIVKKYPQMKIDVSEARSPNDYGVISRIETPKELRGQGLATKAMQDIIAEADKSSMKLALSPSGDWGASVPRLKDFYSRFGFIPNAGRNKDFATRETMIRSPVMGSLAAKLPMDEASRLARATEQGYTIDAFKGGQPYDWDTLPEYTGLGKIKPGTENRVPRELTSINSPNADYAGFFSNSPDVANRFAAPFEHGAVWPAKLKFENPVVIDAKGRHAADFQFLSLARERGTTKEMDKFRGAFKADSPHDGVILKNTKDEGDVYVPRNPDQVRSRFAKFDPKNKGSGNLLGSIAGVAPTAMGALAAQDAYRRD